MIFPKSEDQGRELIHLLFSNHTFSMTAGRRLSLNLIILSLISSFSYRPKFYVLPTAQLPVILPWLLLVKLFVAVSSPSLFLFLQVLGDAKCCVVIIYFAHYMVREAFNHWI